MKNSQIRQLFNKARKIASQFAERCDFVAAKEIKEATASCTKCTAYAGALYKDRVERCQICTSYVYACGLLGLDFFTSIDEDGPASDGRCYMVFTLSRDDFDDDEKVEVE